jgi:hypothetical protein
VKGAALVVAATVLAALMSFASPARASPPAGAPPKDAAEALASADRVFEGRVERVFKVLAEAMQAMT